MAFLWPWLYGAAVSSATWRFYRLVGLPDDEMDDEAPSLVQLILAYAQQADDFELFGDDTVELLVESIGVADRVDQRCELKDKRVWIKVQQG